MAGMEQLEIHSKVGEERRKDRAFTLTSRAVLPVALGQREGRPYHFMEY